MDELAVAASAPPLPRPAVPLQARGVMLPGALYIARPLDAALVAALRSGQWALVHGPRFCGKSSLRARTERALRPGATDLGAGEDAPALACRCAAIDTRALAASSAGAAYLALAAAVAAGLGLPSVNPFWQSCHEQPPAERLGRYLLEEIAQPAMATVLLLDDLDALRELPLELEELLQTLWQVRAALAEQGRERSLTVAFFSSTAADSTLEGVEVFPVPDFTREELSLFAPALAALVREGDPAAVHTWLDAVFAWTAGHPQLTQQLCLQLVARSSTPLPAAGEGDVAADERVEQLVQTLFLDDEEVLDPAEGDPCLRELARALGRSPRAQELLALYRRLLQGVPVTPDPLDALQRELRLCGLCAESEDTVGAPRLRPRCRLVATVLGEDWAREQEVRLLLQEAVASQAGAADSGSTAGLLRGSQLKTAQAWARRHPEALRPPQVRVLLASLEAARTEAEAKHQASAAALQRELRSKTELRLMPARAPSPAVAQRAAPSRAWALPALAAVALALVVTLVALASASRRADRWQRASQQATERALRAEQAQPPRPSP